MLQNIVASCCHFMLTKEVSIFFSSSCRYYRLLIRVIKKTFRFIATLSLTCFQTSQIIFFLLNKNYKFLILSYFNFVLEEHAPLLGQQSLTDHNLHFPEATKSLMDLKTSAC